MHLNFNYLPNNHLPQFTSYYIFESFHVLVCIVPLSMILKTLWMIVSWSQTKFDADRYELFARK